MTIKLVRNAMFITVVIMVISMMGKTSAHETASTRLMVERDSLQFMIER